MDYKKLYASKLCTAREAVKVVTSGDWVDYGWCTGHPVALDQACADLCNKMPAMSGSLLDENEKNLPEEVHAHCGHDHFKMTHPDTEWESCLDHAQKMGLGTRTYKLVQI